MVNMVNLACFCANVCSIFCEQTVESASDRAGKGKQRYENTPSVTFSSIFGVHVVIDQNT